MPLDPQAKSMLDTFAAMGMPPLHTLSVAEARQMMDWMDTAGEPEAVSKTEDREIPGPLGTIPIRIYTPADSGPFPVLVFFHGGGWVIGNIESHDGMSVAGNRPEWIATCYDHYRRVRPSAR